AINTINCSVSVYGDPAVGWGKSCFYGPAAIAPLPATSATNTPTSTLVPTSTTVPTSTSVPPTATLAPTNTPLPTIAPTNTPLPTSTLVPPTATLAPTTASSGVGPSGYTACANENGACVFSG